MSYSEDLETLTSVASRVGAKVTTCDDVLVIVYAKPKAATPDDDLLSKREAARIASTSERVLSLAHSRGELPMLGKQRNRVVRRGDLLAWLAAKSAPVVDGPEADRDIEIRMAKIERLKGARAARAAKRAAKGGAK